MESVLNQNIWKWESRQVCQHSLPQRWWGVLAVISVMGLIQGVVRGVWVGGVVPVILAAWRWRCCWQRWCWAGIIIVSPSSHLPSLIILPTPSRCPHYLSSPLPTPSYPLRVIIPPINHPTSNCSGGWGGVVWHCDVVVLARDCRLSIPRYEQSTIYKNILVRL
jgi:hypothetical protein